MREKQEMRVPSSTAYEVWSQTNAYTEEPARTSAEMLALVLLSCSYI